MELNTTVKLNGYTVTSTKRKKPEINANPTGSMRKVSKMQRMKAKKERVESIIEKRMSYKRSAQRKADRKAYRAAKKAAKK